MKAQLKEVEKRKFTRLEKTLPARFTFPQTSQEPARTFEALSRNIGEGGAFIETDLVQDEDFSLNKDTLLNLEIELLGRAERIKSKGQIAWISRKSRSPRKKRNGFGLRFVQLSAEEKRALSLFVSRQMLAQTERIVKEITLISPEQRLSDRQRRNLYILDTIRKNRLISRAEISRDTDINIVTISNYIDAYLKKGLVFERGLDISSGGRRPELVEINPSYGYVIGVDLGSLNVASPMMRVVATDFTAQVKAKSSLRREDENIEGSLDALKDLIAEVCAAEQVEREKLRGIGIGICGIMDKFGGTVRNPLNGATFANYVSIKKELEDEFGLSVFIENAAYCALFAEKWTGASLEAKSADNMLYIFCNHQCAIMLKGELYTGTSKSAGQLNLFSDLQIKLESEEDLVSAGEKAGRQIASLINMFNPQIVIIGRELLQLGEAFLDIIRRTVSQRAFREMANIVRIIPATLAEEAVACGAASLVIESAFMNI